MTLAPLLITLVTAERVAELFWARHNTRNLLLQGASEVAPGHYPLTVMLHAAWLASLWAFGWNRPINLGWLLVFVILQVLRVWVLTTLGRRWTTRIIVLPGAPLVKTGPYRVFSHPNYVVVIGEIAVLPIVLGLPWLAAIFTLLNACVLWIRVAAENQALRPVARPETALPLEVVSSRENGRGPT